VARRDVTSNVGLPTGANFPTKDEDGNLLETQFGESRFRDQQVGVDRVAISSSAWLIKPAHTPRSEPLPRHHLTRKSAQRWSFVRLTRKRHAHRGTKNNLTASTATVSCAPS
jgi:hypothetical protein